MEKIKNFFKSIALYIKHIFIPEPIEIDDGKLVPTPRPILPIIIIILVFVTYVSIRITDFSLIVLFEKLFGIGYYPNGYRPLTMWGLIGFYLPPDWSYWKEVIPLLIETIQIAFLGSFIGVIFALPMSFFASSNITKTKWVLIPSRVILSILRTLPIIIYASLFVLAFSRGAFPGMLAVSIFTFSIVSKMLFEKIETLDLSAYEAIQSTGASKAKSFVAAVLPQILPNYYSMSLYAFEINVRYAAVLGMVGAGGIGLKLRQYMGNLTTDPLYRTSDRVFVMLFFIWLVVVSIEGLSRYIRRRLA